jgi:NlpC/P60 family putative phage cell wall peptidase
LNNDIITAARGWIGTPYCHQASLKGEGTDCLGLVRGIWRELYSEEPEETPGYSAGWAEAGASETLADAARRHMQEICPADFDAGDLLLFRWRPWLPAKHCGLAIDRTRMIHAQDGARVSEIALSPWWHRRIAFAFSFPERKI